MVIFGIARYFDSIFWTIIAYPVIAISVIILIDKAFTLGEAEFMAYLYDGRTYESVFYRMIYDTAYAGVVFAPLMQNNWYTLIESKYIMILYLTIMPMNALFGFISIILLYWIHIILEPINLLYFIGWQMTPLF